MPRLWSAAFKLGCTLSGTSRKSPLKAGWRRIARMGESPCCMSSSNCRTTDCKSCCLLMRAGVIALVSPYLRYITRKSTGEQEANTGRERISRRDAEDAEKKPRALRQKPLDYFDEDDGKR